MHDLTLSQLPALAWLVSVQHPSVEDHELTESLNELGRLVKTLGHQVVGTLVQRRASPDPATVLGPGKVEELKELLTKERTLEPTREVWVVFDQDISPSQVRQLSKALDAVVYDRTGIILEIFHRHARSRAAKAQVEIVRLAYMAPRLREMRKGGGDRQRGGIGGKGVGESASELDRRKVRDRISELKLELERIERERTTQRARRQNVRRVALVGYTNAGKSTLMSALTQGEVYIADKLFATLDTTVRALVPEVEPRIVVSDTVGFIRKLPHDLVASFRSTLDEALEAGLLLHVVDASDRAHPHHRETTEEVLKEIGADAVPTRIVFNKCDRLSLAEREELEAEHPDGVFVSAREPSDVARLHKLIVEFFAGELALAWLSIPHARGDLRAQLMATVEVLEEKYDEDGGDYLVRAPEEVIDGFRKQLGVLAH
jgi:GTP-binding protein HflX